MGERTDFYVGIGEDIEWIGSLKTGIASSVITEAGFAETEDEYRAIVHCAVHDESAWLGASPSTGWRWSWYDSTAGSDQAFTWYGDMLWSADLSKPHQSFIPFSHDKRFWSFELFGCEWPNMSQHRAKDDE